MVATRIANDFYPTTDRTARVVKALTDRVNIFGSVLECCAGEGDLARALVKHDDRTVISTDIADNWLHDATDPAYWEDYQGYDWVVTNPPFNQAATILRHAWDSAEVGVAFLLRLSFWEPTRDRVSLLQELSDHQVLLFPVSPRLKFRGDTKGVDSVTVAWGVWRKDHSWKALGVDSPFQFDRLER